MSNRLFLGDYDKAWRGWELRRGVLKNQLGVRLRPYDVELMHWERQIWAILRHRIQNGYQMDLFEDQGGPWI